MPEEIRLEMENVGMEEFQIQYLLACQEMNSCSVDRIQTVADMHLTKVAKNERLECKLAAHLTKPFDLRIERLR